MKIVKLLADNGQEFTDCLFDSRDDEATEQHEFDRMPADFGLKLWLTTP